MSKQSHGSAIGKTIATTPTSVTSKQIVSKAGPNVPYKPTTNPLASVSRLQQVKLLDKMNDALNTQKKHIKAVAHKVSNLRILTKEQLNLKSSLIQRTIVEAENRLTKDNLNRLNNRQANTGDKKATSSQAPTSRRPFPISSDAADASLQGSLDLAQNSPIESSSSIEGQQQNWEEFKRKVNKEVESLSNLSIEEQRDLLFNTEEELITKR
jgi:hypothetical protein